MFVKHEIEPLQRVLLDINEQVGEEAVRFRPYGRSGPAR